jgi:predicted PurR-regulated permease PerM
MPDSNGLRQCSARQELAANSLNGTFQAFLTLFLLYFLYRDERNLLSAVRRFSPLTDQETDQVLERLRDTVLATI